MTKIIYENGDIFKFEGGYGLYFTEVCCLLIRGDGGRIEHKIEIGELPEYSMPLNRNESVPYTIKKCFECVMLYINTGVK